MRKRPLMLIASVFLTGLAYQRYSVKLFVLAVGISIVWELWIGRKTKEFRKAAGRSVLLLSAFLLGIFIMQRETSFRTVYMSKIVDGSRITVWGELIKLETTEYGSRGILSECYIDFGEGPVACNDIMMYTSKDHFKVGQIQKITGKVNLFSNARNEGNFDAIVYYQSLKIDFAIDEESSVLLQESTGFLKEKLIAFKENVSAVYRNCLSKKAAEFYQAMVLGDKSNLENSLKELFLLGGISHILAISGLHVSILGRGIYLNLRRIGIGFGIAGIIGGVLLVTYCFMVGNSASTVRAVGMMLMFFLAQWLGRSYDMLNALGGMVLFLLWENPFLIENSGFWFSVTALLGVGGIGKELSSQMGKNGQREHKKCRILNFSGLGMSLGITLMTLPVTALSYYEVPMYSPVVNFVVLPFLTPIFCLAVVCGILGLCGLPQAVIAFFLTPCEWLLGFYELVCSWVAKLPCATIICGKPEWWQIVFYYITLFGGVSVLYFFRREAKEMEKEDNLLLWRRCRGILAVLLVVSVLVIFLPKSKEFEITFLDVGQGDGIYISGGDGSTYFIDGGSSNVNEVGMNRILPFLKSKGIKEIDYWFVSHTDMDHVSGLLEILEKGYKIEHIVLSERCSNNKNQKYLIDVAKKAGVKVIYMEAGHRICSTYLEIICLAPIIEKGETIGTDANENSLVLQVKWKPKNADETFTALFAGDISQETETILCNRGLLKDVDLMKANHHGSNYSNSTLFLGTICPEYIVVSCGKNNIYGHPGVEAVERMKDCGAEIFYTMEGGQITFPLIQYPYENNRQ